MLGKSVGARFGAAALCVVLAACAHHVAQDKATGEDGKTKGAVTLVFDQGEAVNRGIVTYPGGDRVDWKLIELPEGQKVKLDFKLTWQSPRPGLQLAFDVLDEYYVPVKSSQKKGRRQSHARIRTASIDGAKGKYYVRVYAFNRGDAGKYTLTVDYTEIPKKIVIDPLAVEVTDPPHLPELEQPTFTCTAGNFDAAKPECAAVCPAVNPPPNWPACAGQCNLQQPDVELPSCQKVMSCPNPPDIRVSRCKPIEKYWPKCPNPAEPDPNNPRCSGPLPSKLGRIVGSKIQGTETIITIAAGGDNGVKVTWSCVVLQGKQASLDTAPLSGGACTIIRADNKQTAARVGLTVDQLQQNPYVKLTPPKQAP